MRVLVLRPEPQASRMVAELAGRGIDAVAAPMLEVVRRPGVVAEILGAGPAPDVLVFTSAHGVAALASDPGHPDLLGLPVRTVGSATAAAARAAGFADVGEGEGDGGDLARRILDELPASATVVHVGGADRATDVASVLEAAGRSARTVVAYEARPVERLGPAISADLGAGRFDVAVVASRRTAETFRRAILAAGLALPLARPAVLAISQAAGAPLEGVVRRIVIAEAPSGEALTEGVVALCAGLANDGEEHGS